MYSHITLGTNDYPAAERFYDAVMAVLGHPKLFKVPGSCAYGETTGPKLFIVPPFDGQPARPGNGVHAAFIAKSRSVVDEFHRVALAHGGTDEGPPGLRPHYHPNYYGAYVRDPDGNKLQAVCHRRPESERRPTV
jgi:catechol 2,3-dioxygenase-like lactoylglutathione lyase family enzyme